MTENHLKILQLIRTNDGISRAGLAKLTGLSRPAVSTLVDQLLETGLVGETGLGESSGGKPPVCLAVVPEAGGALGIDLGEENVIRGVCCDARGEVLAELEAPCENRCDAIVAAVDELAERLRLMAPSITWRGLGLAVSGIVDTDLNEVVTSSNFDISGKQLAAQLCRRCGLPVVLGNRARLAAQAEKHGGNARDCDDFFYLSVGKSVGCGIYRDGALVAGSFNGAGEISRLLVPADGGMAPLENVIRESYLGAAYDRLTGAKRGWSGLLSAWKKGDSAAVRVIDVNAAQTAYAVAVVANLLNPRRIILGGRFKELGPAFLTQFETHFRPGLLEQFQDRIEVDLSYYGRSAAAIGGAAAVIDKVFRFEL